MIDTIVLTLSKNMFTITDPAAFKPSASWILSERLPRGIKSIQNPSKKELLRGIYKPRLTLSHRRNQLGLYECMLKIELSLPKLIFGNNFAELRYKDFDKLMQKLVAILASMGVVTTAQTLSKAPVAAIHYSKNIKLIDGTIPYQYIKKIKEANVKLSLDTNQTDYRNDGHSFKWHANAYEVVFYDKIHDLQKAHISDKRALEKDNEIQFALYKKLQKRTKAFEILRMEVRLNKKAKIKQLFKKLKIPADLTFKKLFKPAISKKILLHYLDELESKRPMLLDFKSTNNRTLLAALIQNNPDLTPKRIFQLYGLKLAFDEMGPREIRAFFSKQSERAWYRLMAEAREVSLPGRHDPFQVIRSQLVRFEALRNPKI